MIFIRHMPGEMDKETNLQICILCGELLCDGDENKGMNEIRGYSINRELIWNADIRRSVSTAIIGEGDLIAPCYIKSIFGDAKSRRK